MVTFDGLNSADNKKICEFSKILFWCGLFIKQMNANVATTTMYYGQMHKEMKG